MWERSIRYTWLVRWVLLSVLANTLSHCFSFSFHQHIEELRTTRIIAILKHFFSRSHDFAVVKCNQVPSGWEFSSKKRPACVVQLTPWPCQSQHLLWSVSRWKQEATVTCDVAKYKLHSSEAQVHSNSTLQCVSALTILVLLCCNVGGEHVNRTWKAYIGSDHNLGNVLRCSFTLRTWMEL